MWLFSLQMGAQTTPTIRSADQFSSIQAAISDFKGNCGVVFIPQGTYVGNIVINTSNACSNPSNMMILRGAGPGNTVLKPATGEACALTIDATDGPIQQVTIEDLRISNAGTEFSGPQNKGICIRGNNINDHLYMRRVAVYGFYNNLSITGRCIWCEFHNVLFLNSQSDNVVVDNDAEAGLVGLLTFDKVDIETAAGRCFYANSRRSANTAIAFRDGTMQSCNRGGADISNVDGLVIENSAFEANGSAGSYDNILLRGTWIRGFRIYANHILGSTTGNGISMTAAQISGAIDANFISVADGKYAIAQSKASSGLVTVGANFDAGPHNVSVDAAGNYHVAFYGSLPLSTIKAAGTIEPVVKDVGSIRFQVADTARVKNFQDGNPGQLLTVFNEGPGILTIQHSDTKGIYNGPTARDLLLSPGSSAIYQYQPNSLRNWIRLSSSADATRGTTGLIGGVKLAAGSCAKGAARVTNVVVGEPALAAPSDGSDIGGNYSIKAYATDRDTVTVFVCAMVRGNVPAKQYNVVVIH